MCSPASGQTSARSEGRTVTSRRTALHAAWAAPTMVIATSAPAMATSQKRSRLRFTNVTVTDGKKNRTLYVNTKVQVIDGPDPAHNLRLSIRVSGYDTQTWAWDEIAGWGNTEQVRAEWKVAAANPDLKVTFTATADGAHPITSTLTVTPARWWT